MRNRIRISLAAAVLMVIATAGSLFVTPKANAGVWDYVCCGSLCPGGVDACIGSGAYTCCKGGGDSLM